MELLDHFQAHKILFYTTRYLEAIPLQNVMSPSVDKELVLIFGHIGVAAHPVPVPYATGATPLHVNVPTHRHSSGGMGRAALPLLLCSGIHVGNARMD